ncbi:hypothetical protein [Tepidimicrobium xylanilyticum]|uniref:Lipoprotein n=1 Tax=Tepidimicrobium xylanilyticum TaxID=1123352 RepID=A0A1H2V096_9FIRM|nr:hypothetical protein [Tepidimicrobium xylanilyticum]GMG96770.1 hypothetical protein EN5CB1_15960 [Tepidimicrobium xylanilyticum]SDW61349.1 hypothetical protein SAMN05660923_00971 [Tepidimicrobium xylanilyticum]
MENLNRKLLLILLSVSIFFFLFGCNNEDKLESLDKTKDVIRKDVQEVKVKFEKYDIIKSLEEHGVTLETPEIDIFSVKDDVLIFGIRNPTIEIEDVTKATEFGPPVTHSKLMKYDLNKDTLSEIYKFESPIQCYDVAVKGDEVIITYSDHKDDLESLNASKVHCYIAKIKGNKMTNIDSFVINFYYDVPFLATLNGDIYYSYNKKVNNQEVFGINKIIDDSVINIVEYKDIKLLDSRIYSNGKEMMLSIDEGEQAFFYIFNEDGFLLKKPLDLNKRIRSYNLLSNGIIMSIEEKDSGKYYIEFLDLKSDKIIRKHIGPMYYMVNNGKMDCIGTGDSFNLNHFMVRDDQIINTYIDIHNEIIGSTRKSTSRVIRIHPNRKNVYGVYFEGLGIYTNVKILD